MKIYRICTEAKNPRTIAKLAGEMFKGCSIWRGEGYWQGKSEASLMVEVFSELDLLPTVKAFARYIKKLNAQEAVLIQVIKCQGEFV